MSSRRLVAGQVSKEGCAQAQESRASRCGPGIRAQTRTQPEVQGQVVALRSAQSIPAVPPAFDLTQDEGKYQLSGAVPGMDADDITVEVDGNLLVIAGETSETKEQEKNGVKMRSACADSFSQRIFLPPDAVADKIEARVEKGVLTVTMPRAGEGQTSKRKIKINK